MKVLIGFACCILLAACSNPSQSFSPTTPAAATSSRVAAQSSRALPALLADNLAKGLLGYYTFDGQNVDDSSGNGNNGSTSGSVAYAQGAGSSGYAMSVTARPPGSADLPPAAFNQRTSLSIAFWFWASSLQLQNYNAMVYRANRDDNAPYHGWRDRTYAIFWVPGGLHVVYTPKGNKSQYICTDQSFGLASETWHHVALTFDSGAQSAVVYIDGAAAKTCPYAGGQLTSGAKALLLGNTYNNQQGNTGAFTGMTDDVRLYRRTLSAADVATLYKDVE